jgi:hypothetical protein
VNDSVNPIDVDLAALDSLLEDVAAKAQASRPANAEGLTEPEELALLLFVSTFEVYLGMRALLRDRLARDRLAEEVRMLSRTLLDDTARLLGSRRLEMTATNWRRGLCGSSSTRSSTRVPCERPATTDTSGLGRNSSGSPKSWRL